MSNLLAYFTLESVSDIEIPIKNLTHYMCYDGIDTGNQSSIIFPVSCWPDDLKGHLKGFR